MRVGCGVCEHYRFVATCLSFCFSPSALVETIQSNPILILEPPFVTVQRQESVMETSIPVPVLNWQDASSRNPTVAECV